VTVPYQFTTQEIQQLQAARAQCPAGDGSPTSTGNWVPFYTALSNIPGRHIGDESVSGADLQDMKNAKLWLDVAIGANGGTDMHSAFICTYTNRQGELRLDRVFTDAEMQRASNGVALKLWQHVSGIQVQPGQLPWTVPPISVIAERDASSIGENLFVGRLSDGDTAITANAAWSGALGFNLLAAGRTNAQIGQCAGRSEKAIRNQLTHVYAKLGVANRAEAVAVHMRAQLEAQA
jgi:Bacterial regulatory proteins, luxR family